MLELFGEQSGQADIDTVNGIRYEKAMILFVFFIVIRSIFEHTCGQ